jgi:predicted RNA-binding protein YlxR (DUF448 family)
VGCRKRAPASELLRIVAVRNDVDQRNVDHYILVPDPTRRRPGRGAHLHADPACLASAQRRRVFGRAFRVPGVIDAESLVRAVSEWSACQSGHPTADGRQQPMVGALTPHLDTQGRTTDMSTR